MRRKNAYGEIENAIAEYCDDSLSINTFKRSRYNIGAFFKKIYHTVIYIKWTILVSFISLIVGNLLSSLGCNHYTIAKCVGFFMGE